MRGRPENYAGCAVRSSAAAVSGGSIIASMSSSFDDVDPTGQPVERRGEPRGIMRGLAIVLPGDRRVDAVEASRKGLFAEVDDPDAFVLGDVFEIAVSRDTLALDCRVEVVRKEIHPRRGVALRIVYYTPVAEETYKKILDSA
jgi:hypothetical protein